MNFFELGQSVIIPAMANASVSISIDRVTLRPAHCGETTSVIVACTINGARTVEESFEVNAPALVVYRRVTALRRDGIDLVLEK